MKKILIQGASKGISATGDNGTFMSEYYEAPIEYQLTSTRSTTDSVELPCTSEDIIELVFIDGAEWVSSVDNIPELFKQNNETTRGEKSDFILPPVLTLESQDGKRGMVKFVIKAVRFFAKKKAQVKNVKDDLKIKLGEKLDHKLMPVEGLYRIDKNFHLQPFNLGNKKGGKYILFIHGFLSSLEGAFKGITDITQTNLWTKILNRYGDNILGYDHKTVSKSPIENTLELLKQLPEGCTLEIISHSRGGLIADVLSRCSAKNPIFFDDKDFKYLDVSENEKELLANLEKLAEKKKIIVEKVVRVCCPAKGTLLLTKRLDHFLNGALYAIGLSTGAEANFVYKIFKAFLKDVIGSKSDPNIFPGIASMHPDSPFQKMINAKHHKTEDDLFVIQGDAQFGGGIKQSVLVILSNLFFWEANDFVVHTASMRFGVLRNSGACLFLSQDAETTHFNYFKNQNTKVAIADALDWDGSNTPDNYECLKDHELEEQAKQKISFSRGEYGTSGNRELDLVDILFGPDARSAQNRSIIPLKLSLVHGDLRFAKHPILVGHFAEDGIVSAERALDLALSSKLNDRYLSGNYPSSTNESAVIIEPEGKPKGGIVIGLGENIDFTEAELRKAVYHGILKYCIYLRDSVHPFSSGNFNTQAISSLFIGSSYGNLDMDSALTAILFGVSHANDKIQELNKNNKVEDAPENPRYISPIREIEFVELFAHVARKAFYSFKQIKMLNYSLEIEIPEEIEKRYGGRRKIEYKRDTSWWHNLLTEKTKISPHSQNQGIRFISSSGRAKVTDIQDHYSKDLVEELIKDFSKQRVYESELSNTLYHLLIPKRIQSEIRNQSNILWKMDLSTAEYPWEMIHDKDSDIEPVFVNTGMIRQLVSKKINASEKIIRENSALIIGDPVYTHYSPLPFAKKEAEYLYEKLKNDDAWTEKCLINKKKIDLVSSMLNSKYKLLHIAGHGVYDNETQESGLVMEDKIIDSVFFSKLPYVPEFVFINCCYSGDIDADFEETYQSRYKLAASIGIQLIEMGVSAAIITGWAVDDRAALEFADTFYDLMLGGETFGRAVQKSRKRIYDNYPGNMTWGAYQCYGDPWYRLTKGSKKKNSREKYLDEEEVLIDLHNIKSKLRDKKDIQVKKVLADTQEIYEVAIHSQKLTPAVLENLAEIFTDVDDLDKAIELYEDMMKENSANYSVKGLEQYCNLKIKALSRDALASKEVNVKKAKKEEAEKVLGHFKNLLSISKTKERLNLLASAYKRFAYALDTENPANLKEMIRNYQNAYREYEANDISSIVYPLSNFLQGQFFINTQKRGIQLNGEFKAAEDLIRPLKKELAERGIQHENFWEDIALINILMTQIFYEQDTHLIQEIKEEIIKDYTMIFEQAGTYRHLRAEIEHFEFLLFLFDHQLSASRKKKEKDRWEAIKEIGAALKDLKK